jgi:hypothetical protein
VDLRARLGVAATVVVTVAILGGAVGYLAGGGRVHGNGPTAAYSGVPVGEEVHTTLFIEVVGGPVEIVSAEVRSSSDRLAGDVRVVVSEAQPVFGVRGPRPGVRTQPVANRRIAGESTQLDMRLVATAPGRHDIDAVAITYRAGAVRERTAILPMSLCVDAVVAAEAPAPSGGGACAAR